MTDSITRCCKNISLLVLFPLIFWACPARAEEGIQVRQAELVRTEAGYQLNAEFSVGFIPEAEKALNKGVRLDFLVEFQLVSPREYWFDKEIVTRTRRIGLQYHALSRQYLIMVGRQQKAFDSLEQAREELGKVHGWAVLEHAHVVAGGQYAALLRFRLDPASLPRALQVEALGTEKWSMVSERYRWIPVL